MICSPNKMRKTFPNKRDPIQFFIPQIKDDDLKEIINVLNVKISKEKAEKFGGNLFQSVIMKYIFPCRKIIR